MDNFTLKDGNIAMEELLCKEVKKESYVRALTDNFSVVDIVKNDNGEEAKSYGYNR